MMFHVWICTDYSQTLVYVLYACTCDGLRSERVYSVLAIYWDQACFKLWSLTSTQAWYTFWTLVQSEEVVCTLQLPVCTPHNQYNCLSSHLITIKKTLTVTSGTYEGWFLWLCLYLVCIQDKDVGNEISISVVNFTWFHLWKAGFMCHDVW